MFYWTVGRHRVVLTDDEEDELPAKAGFNAEETIDVRIAHPGGDRLEKRLGAYLESYAARAPDEFRAEYIERRGSGPEALPTLHALVDAYTLAHGRAVWGVAAELDALDRIGLALWLGRRPDAIYITLTVPTRRWFRKKLVPTGLIAFPSAEIEMFAGNYNSFVLTTSRMSVLFSSDFVRVVSRPDSADDDLP